MYSLIFLAITSVCWSQKAYKTSQCLFNEGSSCTVNPAGTLVTLEATPAAEESSEFTKGANKNDNKYAEVVEHIFVCGGFKSKDACREDLGCIWRDDGAGDSGCNVYERLVPEFLSCVEEDQDKWAGYSEEDIQKAFLKAEVSPDDIRCNIASTYYTQLCQMKDGKCDFSETVGQPGFNPVDAALFGGFSGGIQKNIGEVNAICAQRPSNYEDCEILDLELDADEKVQVLNVDFVYDPEVVTGDDVEGVLKQQVLGYAFDMPAGNIELMDLDESEQTATAKLVFISEAAAVAAHDLLSSGSGVSSKLAGISEVTLIETFVNVPSSEVAADADLSEFAGDLPDLKELFTLEGLVPKDDTLVAEVIGNGYDETAGEKQGAAKPSDEDKDTGVTKNSNADKDSDEDKDTGVTKNSDTDKDSDEDKDADEDKDTDEDKNGSGRMASMGAGVAIAACAAVGIVAM